MLYHVRRVTGPLALLAAASQAACVSGTTDSGDTGPRTIPLGSMAAECAEYPATVAVGTGSMAYEPLQDGDPATIVHGPQGGWHVLASGRIANTLNVVTISYSIRTLPEGTPVSWNQYRVQLVPYDTCTGDYPGMYGYLDVSALADGEADTPPELLVGRELELTLQVEDADGRAASGSVTVVGALDPTDAAR